MALFILSQKGGEGCHCHPCVICVFNCAVIILYGQMSAAVHIGAVLNMSGTRMNVVLLAMFVINQCEVSNIKCDEFIMQGH